MTHLACGPLKRSDLRVIDTNAYSALFYGSIEVADIIA
jgi:hypothetical protein